VSKPASETIEKLLITREGVQLLKADGEKPRRFSMLAYTGAEFQRWYGRAMIDMAGIEGPDRLPILLNHDDSKVAGFADDRKLTSDGLRLEGVLSRATETGIEVAKLSDEGFPFTASVGVAVLSREELAEGATTKVNGREVRGPLTIWRKTRLGETSFVTAFPADSNTEAHALTKPAQQLMEQNLPPQGATTPSVAHLAAPPAPQGETAEQAKARLGRLRAAFPGRDSFVLDEHLAGHDVQEAKASLCDVLLREQADRMAAPETASLRQVAGLPESRAPLGFSGTERQAGGAQVLLRMPTEEALRHMAPEEAAEKLYSHAVYQDALADGGKKALTCFLRADRAGLVSKRAMAAAALILQERGERDFTRNGFKPELLASWGKSGPDYSAITVKGIIGSFYKGLETEIEGSWAPEIGAIMSSNQETETYKWLGHAPAMREWIGARLAKGAPIRGYQLTNKIFESTMHVDVEDYRFDKTGQIMIRASEQGARAVQHWEKLASEAIEANGTAWDSVAFFATSHSMGGEYTTSQTNLLTVADDARLNVVAPSAPTRNEMIDVMIALAQKMYTYKDNAGEPYNGGAKKFVLMVSTNMLGAAKSAARASMVNAGESNALKDLDFDIRPLVNPRLTSTAVVYLFRVDSAMKPLILQEASAPEFEFQGQGTDGAFENNQYRWGAKAVRNVGYGEWAHAIKATLG
jgi:phage major head subunit gpT-like protein